MAEAENVDPRAEAVGEWLGALQGDGSNYRHLAKVCLAHADAADPLRVLLADEDRAVHFLRAATEAAGNLRLSFWAARAVLAALQEVAGL